MGLKCPRLFLRGTDRARDKRHRGLAYATWFADTQFMLCVGSKRKPTCKFTYAM